MGVGGHEGGHGRRTLASRRYSSAFSLAVREGGEAWGASLEQTNNDFKKTSTRRGGRESSRHIDAFRAVRCCSSLMRATSGHPAARLLQPCLRRQCKPAPAAGGAHRRLMGPTSSTPGPTALQDPDVRELAEASWCSLAATSSSLWRSQAS